MGTLKRRTITIAEIKQVQKALERGVAKEIVAGYFNIREDCVMNFATPEIRAKATAIEKIEAEERAKEKAKKERLKKMVEEEVKKVKPISKR